MTNDSPHSDASVLNTADPELEQLLGEACDAPPIPRSLLKRIDRGVQNEWGVSPGLADRPSAKVARSLSDGAWSVGRRARWMRALPIAATLSVLIVLGVVFNANSSGYAWADMLEAIAKRGVLEVQDAQGVRWLSLADGVVGERTSASSQLIDVRRQVVLQREAQATTIRRSRLSEGVPSADRNQLLVGFLLGGAALMDDSGRLEGLRLVEENWERVSSSSPEQIALQATFEAGEQNIQLRLLLDAKSQLPQSCEVLRGEASPVTFAMRFLQDDARQLRDREFPPELPVVDVDEPAERTMAAMTPVDDAAAIAPMVPQSDKDVLTNNPLVHDQVAPKESGPSTLLAAVTQWSAVTVPTVADEQVVQEVNTVLEELWDANGVEPAPAADDEELLRRVYLDLAGRTPSVHEVRSYLKDASADRYEQLVERLLDSPDHASHLATVWRTFLIPEGVDLTAFGGVAAFDEWLAERFGDNEPYDKVVRSLLLAEGRLSKSGPLLFYSATKLNPDQLASRTARVFLGMRLECAQCHDHPFEPWTQEDFWSYAAFFARISRPQGELENVSTVMRVRDVDRGDVMLPETQTVVPPRFLDGTAIQTGEQSPARRQQLAQWLTSAGNPYFARAASNRVWGHMFGKGIIDPVDDFGQQHPPTSPELLDLLAGHFIGSGFDLRELFRTVALSRAYRLSSGAATNDEQRLKLFAQMNVKTLTAEQVYDCISVATMLDTPTTANPYDLAVVRFGNSDRDAFLQQFRTPAGRMTEYQGGIPQALTLMNGGLIEGATGLSSSGLLSSLEAPFFTNQQRIEVLYLATLSRRPRESEWALLNGYVPDEATDTQLKEGLADLLWALLNSAEFTMNH